MKRLLLDAKPKVRAKHAWEWRWGWGVGVVWDVAGMWPYAPSVRGLKLLVCETLS